MSDTDYDTDLGNRLWVIQYSEKHPKHGYRVNREAWVMAPDLMEALHKFFRMDREGGERRLWSVRCQSRRAIIE